MHLRARRDHEVSLPALGKTISFEQGETLHTEISRKFTRESTAEMLAAAGFELVEWYTPDNDWFALSLSVPIE